MLYTCPNYDPQIQTESVETERSVKFTEADALADADTDDTDAE